MPFASRGRKRTISRVRSLWSRSRSPISRCSSAISATDVSALTRNLLPERVTFWPVVLRPFSQDDAPQVQLLAGERDVAVMTALIPHPYPDGAASAWISTLEGERVAETEYTYAVTRSI